MESTTDLIVDLRQILRLKSHRQLSPDLLALSVVGVELFCDGFDTLAFWVSGIRKLSSESR